jgi:hypothetical protein
MRALETNSYQLHYHAWRDVNAHGVSIMIQGLTITVDWDTADAIMEAHLLDTYHSLKDNIKVLKSKKKLQDFEQEDLEQFERVLESIEVVGSWYVYDFDKKKRKKKK